MKRFVALLLPLLLAGCWTGPKFYTTDEAEAAIPAGLYKVVNIEDPFADAVDPDFGKRVRVSYAPDGHAFMNATSDGSDGPANVILVNLPGKDNIFIAQAELDTGNPKSPAAIYGLINIIPGGYQLALPKCDGTRRLKEGSNVTVKGVLFGKTQCSFADRVSFEAAMQDFAQDPIRWTEYKRIKD